MRSTHALRDDALITQERATFRRRYIQKKPVMLPRWSEEESTCLEFKEPGLPGQGQKI